MKKIANWALFVPSCVLGPYSFISLLYFVAISGAHDLRFVVGSMWPPRVLIKPTSQKLVRFEQCFWVRLPSLFTVELIAIKKLVPLPRHEIIISQQNSSLIN